METKKINKYYNAVLLLSQVVLVVSQSCQEINLIKECFCKRISDLEVEITCRRLTMTSQVQAALMASKNCVVLNIEDSTLPSLPLELGPHSLRNLTISNSKMLYISPPTHPTRSAFDGLKNLYRLKLENVADITDWDWTKLDDLPNLTVLYINGGRLNYIPKDFSLIGGTTLVELFLANSGLTSIAKGGLAFPSVKVVQIINEPLDELSADMFHEDNQIEILIIQSLHLKILRSDLLTSMNKLKSLVIDSTVFPLLTDDHFPSREIEFSLYPGDDMISCDCKHKWILKRKPQYLGICSNSDEETVDFQDFLQHC